jgi:HEAT repeat protein/tetratricopeptide (TPR) repeat protein
VGAGATAPAALAVVAAAAAAAATAWSVEARAGEAAGPAPAAVAAATEPGGGFDRAAAERLKKVVEGAAEPGYALDLLLDYYRTRAGGLTPLVEEYRARTVAEPGSPTPWFMLGWLYAAEGDAAAAAAAFGEAAVRSPKDPRPHFAAAQAFAKLGDPVRARAAYEEALARLKAGGKHGWAETKMRGDVVRALGALALDAGDLAAARARYADLVKTDPFNPHLRFELPAALASRGRVDEAIAEYDAVARGAGKDGKTRVAAMKEIGALLEERGELDRALETYRAALKLLAPDHYLAHEVEDRIVGVYRKRDDLRGLIAWYEGRGAGAGAGAGAHQLALLAGLYEEVGRDEDAIGAYKKALARGPAAVELRLRLLAVYKRIGRATEMLAEYEKLIASAPDEPRYRIDYAGALWARGDKSKALAALAGLAGRWPRDASVRAALADVYTRWGERARAIKELEALVMIEPGEETHRVALGELWWQEGETKKALDVWATLLEATADKARAHARLGEVLGEHGLLADALEHFTAAEKLRPGDRAALRGRALLFEREKRWGDAVAAWEEVLAARAGAGADAGVGAGAAAAGAAPGAVPASGDRSLAEAREHLVEAHDRFGTLRHAMEGWRTAFERKPPDAAAGMLLALALARVGDAGEAARVLASVVGARTDVGALLDLEKLHVAAERWSDAVAVLAKLAAADPAHAGDYYARIADDYANLYDDAKAREYARKAVDLAASDAGAWERLGRIEVRLRDRAAAIAAYEKATAMAPRDFHLAFALCDLYGDDPRADVLLVDVLGRASDDGDVLRAARKAIRRATTRERLQALEAQVLALYHTPPPRKVFRAILVELYGVLVEPLWRADDPASRAALSKMGERALKPLVDALGDEDGLSRASAVELLGYLGNPGAALPLARLLEERDVGLRLRAAAALGRLRDLRGAAALARALGDPEPPVRAVAAWALGMIRSPHTVEYLTARERTGVKDLKAPVRALAALALGARGDAAAAKPLRALLGDPDVPVRRAAAWALARLGAREAAGDLRALLGRAGTDVPTRRAAAAALGRLGDIPALPALLAALWDGDATLRAVSASAVGVLLGGGAPLASLPDLGPYQDAASTRIDVDALLLVVESGLGAGADVAKAARVLLTDYAPVAVVAVRVALLPVPAAAAPFPPAGGAGAAPAASAAAAVPVAGVGRRLRVALDLDMLPDAVALGPLTLSAVPGGERAAELREPLRRFGEALVPVLVEALAAADGSERTWLASALGKAHVRAAAAALAPLADARDDRLREAVAEALGRSGDASAAPVLAKLAHDGVWIVRLKAVRALGALHTPAAPAVCAAVLASDPFSVVQEQAALALAELGPLARDAAPALITALRHEDGAVRAAAAAALGALGDRASDAALAAAAGDPEERVRRAVAAARARLAE